MRTLGSRATGIRGDDFEFWKCFDGAHKTTNPTTQIFAYAPVPAEVIVTL